MYRLSQPKLFSIPCHRAWLPVVALFFSSSLFAADIQVRNLEDFEFGIVPATVGDLVATASFCVAMEPRGRYSLLGFGSGSARQFELLQTGTGLHSLDYLVRITDRGRGRGESLHPGIPLTNLRASPQRRNGRCNPEGSIRVDVSGREIAGAHPGHYSGTLTLTVVPE